MSSKLVIFKNQDAKGNSITLLFVARNNKFFFVQIADIYIDANKRELVMPKNRAIMIAHELSRDLIPSVKYKGCYVLAPDSDFQIVFKEVETPQGERAWCLVYDEITLHLYSWYVEYAGADEWLEDYLSTHQINHRKKIEARKERHQNEELHRMAQELNDELFEEAGYDFMD